MRGLRTVLDGLLLQRAGEVLRMLVTAGIGWQVCLWLGAAHAPVYAVIVPLVATRTDPFSAAGVSFTRVLGVFVGVSIGMLMLTVLPPGLPAILAALALGLVLASIRPRTAAMNLQFALSALLVFAAADSGPEAYAWSRLWETGVGAVITVLMSVILLPPRPSVAVRSALTDLADALGAAVDAAVDPGNDRAPALAEAAAAQAAALDADHRRAVRSARLLPFGRTQRAQLAALTSEVALARSVARHITALADSVQDFVGRDNYREQATAIGRELAHIAEPLRSAIRDALTGVAALPDRERAVAALLAFRADDPSVLATVVRHPIRRVLDDLARHDHAELPQLA